MSRNDKTKLPVLGIGPIYVIGCLLLTIGGIFLKDCAFMKSAYIESAVLPLSFIGFLFIAGGVALWIKAALFQKISREIKAGRLVTSGVYSIVRNPIYSAFLFIFSGILFTMANLYLLLLPFIFWVFLTILMKQSEEKWLKDKFGDAYTNYCKRVNRVIPWFAKKRRKDIHDTNKI